MTNLQHLAFITPRYGKEVIGGAEFGARMMAENIALRLGIKVEILTTTAINTDTWDNHYLPGEEHINGVLVRRFLVDQGRDPGFSKLSGRLLKYPKSATIEESEAWIDAQGPVSNDLIHAIASSDADALLFFPYLYHPMVRGIARVAQRSILIPAAHDEEPAYLPIFPEMFQSARAIIFQTRAEERLVDSIFKTAHKPRLRLGLGIEESGNQITPLSELAPQLEGSPFLLTLGRVDQLKGATLLSELFAEYKRRNPGKLKLVFAGPVTTQPIEFPDIVTMGTVSDETKWALLNNCIALVNPSGFESFSLVLFEAWSQKKPVLVNSLCEVTSDHALDSGGGFAFSDYPTFEAQLNLLYSHPEIRHQLGKNGYTYARNNYRWDVIVDKLEAFLTGLFKA